MVFPLIVASCFAPRVEARKKAAKERAERKDTPPSPPEWASLVGKPSSAAVAAIKASDPAVKVVVIPEGALVTREYKEDRCAGTGVLEGEGCCLEVLVLVASSGVVSTHTHIVLGGMHTNEGGG